MRFFLAILIGVSGAASAADNGTEAMTWLKKIAGASRQANYSGTFVYQHGNRVETSRVVHFVNPAGGEFERLETLDGPAREVVRTNDQVTCYLPDTKTVLIEQRNSRQFPTLLPDRLAGISESYSVRTEERDRVAGFECMWVALLPKDNLRYGRRFCAEVNTGLPLRARTLNEKGEPVESFTFTQLAMGGTFTRDKVRSKYAERARQQSWKVDRSALSVQAEQSVDTGWTVASQPPGFRKTLEVRRSIHGRSTPVSHLVFSDGLSAVSVFVEPMPASHPSQSLTHKGAVNIFTRPIGNYVVTALGEVPATTVMQIANSVEARPPAAAAR